MPFAARASGPTGQLRAEEEEKGAKAEAEQAALEQLKEENPEATEARDGAG